MKTFYLTFGQKYPWRNGWAEVEAPSYEKAREYVVEIFGEHWAFLYTEEEFTPEKRSFFPAGKIGETII